MDYCDNQTEHDKPTNNEELYLYCDGKPMEARKRLARVRKLHSSQTCAVGRTTIPPTSTSAGCSIAKAMARAIASGEIASCFFCVLLPAEALAEGKLRQVLGDWTPPYPGFFLYDPRHRHLGASMRTFLGYLRSPLEPLAVTRIEPMPDELQSSGGSAT